MAPQTVKVVVTGFGPFRDHKVNSSWVAVKRMKETGGLGPNIQLEIVEIKVEYETVDQVIPRLWKSHKPQLMIHVGVSGRAKVITLEDRARNDAYTTPDINGKSPRGGCCKRSGDSCLKTTLDLSMVVVEVQKRNPDIAVEMSADAGRYLCEYIYYTSLSQKKAPVAFIHVPPLRRAYTEDQLADGIRTVINLMVEQIQKNR